MSPVLKSVYRTPRRDPILVFVGYGVAICVMLLIAILVILVEHFS